MSRGPTLRIPAVGQAIKGADAVDFARDLRQFSMASGRLVTATFAAATTVSVRHGLKRRYVGAFIVGQSAQHTQSISAVDPVTWEASGNDASVYLGVQAGSSGGATHTGTVYLWVF